MVSQVWIHVHCSPAALGHTILAEIQGALQDKPWLDLPLSAPVNSTGQGQALPEPLGAFQMQTPNTVDQIKCL